MKRIILLALTIILSTATLTGCSESPASEQNSVYPSPSDVPASQRAVSLNVGHCFVAPVEFRGEEWLVPLALNYGGAGGQFFDHYLNWRGRGSIRLLEPTRALYEDEGGPQLRFRPAVVLEKSEDRLARSCD